MKRLGHYYFVFLVVFIVFWLDRISKIVARSLLSGERAFYLIDHWLGLGLIDTRGIFNLVPIPEAVMITVILLLLVIFLRWYFAWRRSIVGRWFAWSDTACGLVVGGAIGNIYDRISYSAVIDWIMLSSFSVINLADIMIIVGLTILFVFVMKR